MTTPLNAMTETAFWIIVPAAGVGARMGARIPKQYLPLAGRTVLERTLERLLSLPQVDGVVVATSDEDSHWFDLPISLDPRITRVSGGLERNLSVLNALTYLENRATPDDWVLVHDAARPCVRIETILALREALSADAVGGILAVPVADTLKMVVDGSRIEHTVDRNLLWQAQTPQLFRFGLLRDCLQRALKERRRVTDEASAFEYYGYQPRVVEGRADNLKITRPEDLALAEWILQQQEITL